MEAIGAVSGPEQAVAFYEEILIPFIFHDIQAAVDGEANYLAALGLVCYTEFLGGLARGTLKSGKSQGNFECFFDRLGEGYRTFRQSHDTVRPKSHSVYRVYRCGLVHEYMIKAVRHPATVFMYDNVSALEPVSSTAYSLQARVVTENEPIGPPIAVGIKQDGGYYFVVEAYFRDFKKAAEQLVAEVRSDQEALSRFVKALNSVL